MTQRKSLLIKENIHYKLKILAVIRKKKIQELIEQIILTEYNNEPQCNPKQETE